MFVSLEDNLVFASEFDVRDYFLQEVYGEYYDSYIDSFLTDNYSGYELLTMEEHKREDVFLEFENYIFDMWKEDNVKEMELWEG